MFNLIISNTAVNYLDEKLEEAGEKLLKRLVNMKTLRRLDYINDMIMQEIKILSI